LEVYRLNRHPGQKVAKSRELGTQGGGIAKKIGGWTNIITPRRTKRNVEWRGTKP